MMEHQESPYTRVVGGCSTYSKVAYRHLPHWPASLIGGAGSTVWGRTKEGKEKNWIDCTASLGAVLLGYTVAPPTVPSVPAPSLIEEEVATILCQAVPHMDQVRFCKNGSDATEAAIRIARYHTQKAEIFCNSYHGSHSDLVTATPGKAGGILGMVDGKVRPFSSPQRLLDCIALYSENVAAVILEPLTPGCQHWRLEEVQKECRKKGIILILDEMITGWRVRGGSAVPAIQADLYCFGKAIGGGMPLACIGGKRKLMQQLEEEVFMSGTYAGEQASLRAGEHLLEWVQRHEGELYRFLHEWGWRLGASLGGLVQGYPQRWTLLDFPERDQFVDTLAREGVLVGRDFFPMWSHQGEEDLIIQSIQKARKEVKV